MPENLYNDMYSYYNEKMPSEHYLYLMFNKKTIIGFQHFLFYPQNKNAELFAIAVDPEFQNRGYAKNMINESINFLISLNCTQIKVSLIKSEEEIVILENYFETLVKVYKNIKFVIEKSR